MILKAAQAQNTEVYTLPLLPFSLSIFLRTNHFLSILLTEEEGRDLSCIVASLVQVMLDPYFRTITGFQSLIQKEWVMAGYPFLDRCNHLKRSEKEVTKPSCLLSVLQCAQDKTFRYVKRCSIRKEMRRLFKYCLQYILASWAKTDSWIRVQVEVLMKILITI